MKTQQNISIRIADVPPLSMTIAPENEEMVRRAEYSVNMLWNKWRRDFPKVSNKELLAMVTFQFAKLYCQLQEQIERQQTVLDDFESELDRLLELAAEKE